MPYLQQRLCTVPSNICVIVSFNLCNYNININNNKIIIIIISSDTHWLSVRGNWQLGQQLQDWVEPGTGQRKHLAEMVVLLLPVTHQTASSPWTQPRHPRSTRLCTPSISNTINILYQPAAAYSSCQRIQLDTYDLRAFALVGPTVWNALGNDLCDPDLGIASFCHILKMHLFQ